MFPFLTVSSIKRALGASLWPKGHEIVINFFNAMHPIRLLKKKT
jgi:hypothetical protein